MYAPALYELQMEHHTKNGRINSGNNSSNITIFIRKQRFVNDPADCKMDEPYK